MDETPTRTYENDDIIVYWYADRCQKAKQCLIGSWQAFDLSRRPWVDVNAIPAKELAEIIDRCPTKALMYELKEMNKLSVCKVTNISDIDLASDFYFVGKTDEELSLVCKTEDTPQNTTEREDGWRGFRIQGVLDFSLIGVLSKLSGILAEHKIGIFAVSTYNTDYILVKEENYERSLEVLISEGYTVI